MRTVDTTMHRGRRNRPRRLLTAAIDGQRRMRFAYRDAAGTVTERVVSPYEVRGDLVIGWDHDRWDFRTFRMERIQESAIVDEPAFQASEEI